MPEEKVETSDDDMHRIVEVLQTQLASMQKELNELKADKKGKTGAEAAGIEIGEETIPEPEPEPETREEVIDYMKKLPGIGLTKANALYDNGFDSTAKLKEATADDLIAVPGIGPSMASKLVVSIEQLEKGELAPTIPAPPPIQPPPAEGGGVMGFFKSTYKKVIGFVKGKKPEGEAPGTGEQAPEEAPEMTVSEEEAPTKEESEGPEPPVPDTESSPEPSAPSPDGSVEISSEEPPSPQPPAPSPDMDKDPITQFREIEGVTEAIAKALFEAGYESMDELREAEEADLVLVKGIGPEKAKMIVEALK